MPIKQVTCSVCGATVNKAQTYHVGDKKRACKSHPGVGEKRDNLEVQKKQHQADQARKLKARRQPSIGGASMWSGDHGLKCWVCMNPGIRQDQYYIKVLIEMEKIKKLHGIVNPLEPKHRIRMDKRCIFIIPEGKAESAMKYVREDFKRIVEMSRFLAICGPCCQVSKINPLPPVDMDQLAAASCLYTAFLEPVLSAEAGRQLARDN